MARPKVVLGEHEFRQIKILTGYGLRQGEIANVLGVSEKTFRRRKKDMEGVLSAIEKGRINTKIITGKALLELAKKGNIAAIKWFEMTRLGMGEKRPIETHFTEDQLRKMAKAYLD